MHNVALPYPTFAELAHVWRECVTLAWEAHVAGSLPIAAVAVDHEGGIVARGRNRLAVEVAEPPHVPGTPYIAGVPLAHAEVNALLELGYRRAGDAKPTLYTTMEPCPLCMGAARMSGVAHVVFATRDAWAGCSAMAETVPYLKDRGPTVEGPVSALEAPLFAWQVSVHLDRLGESPDFMSVLEASLPEAFAAARLLHERGDLARMAKAGAPVDEAWHTVIEAVTEAGA